MFVNKKDDDEIKKTIEINPDDDSKYEVEDDELKVVFKEPANKVIEKIVVEEEEEEIPQKKRRISS